MDKTEQALLRTVLENPDTDEPKLVLADYLEDRGDLTASAKIRCKYPKALAGDMSQLLFEQPCAEQVPESILSICTCPGDPILEGNWHHHLTWTEGLSTCSIQDGSVAVCVRHGFFVGMAASWRTFKKHAAFMFRTFPLQWATLSDCDPLMINGSWFAWQICRDHNHREKHELPPAIFRLLNRFGESVSYDSSAEAFADLERACLKYGREFRDRRKASPRKKKTAEEQEQERLKTLHASEAEKRRIMMRAADTLWKRLRLHRSPANMSGRNKLDGVLFLRNHERLLKCINHLHELDSRDGRAISVKTLSTGECSAMMYLMGCSKSDGDSYRDQDAPSEDSLDWSMWDSAKEFWSCVANDDVTVKAFLDVLAKIVDPEGVVYAGGLLGAEKRQAVTWAWNAFSRCGVVKKADMPFPELLMPENWLDFGGIDLGEVYVERAMPALEEDER